MRARRYPPAAARARENVLTVDVEEYYHGMEFGTAFGAGVDRLPSRVVTETRRLLDVLDASGARGTFFTLGIVAERERGLVRDIVARGHEIASHGWDHSLAFVQGPERFRVDVRRARHALEQAAGVRVVGYRAPQFSIRPDSAWAFGVLAEEGYTYDSSLHPIAHDRYGFPGTPRFLHRRDVEGIWEVPVGTARLAGVNVPLGGGFFRLFPVGLIRAAIASVNRCDDQPVVFYVHPWELDPHQPRPPMPLMHRVRHYVGLDRAEGRLRLLLSAFRFTSIARAWPHAAEPPAGTRTAAAG
jgi:polysaccharide deacetylase family protein (PEP-CTERM system associated)